MPRFAIVTVVEADFAEIAWEATANRLGKFGLVDAPPLAVFVGEPSPVAELDEYDSRGAATAILTDPDAPGNTDEARAAAAAEARATQAAASAARQIAEGVPQDDEWRSAASFIERTAGILDRNGVDRPQHYVDEDAWR